MTRSTRRLQWTLTLALSGALLCGTAGAQSPSSTAGPSSGSGSGSSSAYGSESGAPAGGGSASLGTVSNETTETTSITTATGADFETAEAPLPNTGGEPLLVTMLGSLLAGSALLLRRKVS